MENTKVFEYTDSDFHYKTHSWPDSWKQGNDCILSRFDSELRSSWDKAVSNGHFRYKMDEVTTRIIPGSKRYVAQLNIKRGIERRKPQAINSITQPYDDSLFNFTKIKEEEILFELSNKSRSTLKGDDTRQTGKHIVIINVSPLEYGHILLVPDVNGCVPQIVTRNMLRLGIEMMLLSSQRGFRMGFNSLCAYASVNHQHMHGYYCEHELYVEYADTRPITNRSHCHELVNTPAKALVLQLHDTNIEELVENLYTVTSYCQNENVAYNVFMTRGLPFGGPSVDRTLRVIVYPRKSVFGIPPGKMAEDTSNKQVNDVAFNVALAELSGHLPIKVADQYECLTEEQVDNILASASVSNEQFEDIKLGIIAQLGTM